MNSLHEFPAVIWNLIVCSAPAMVNSLTHHWVGGQKLSSLFSLDKMSLDSKEITPVNPKGNQPWIFIRRTDAEAEAPGLWPPDVKSWLIEKDPDAGKDWGQEKKGATEDEMVGWHHRLNGHEFEQSPGDSEDQESLCAAVHGVTKSQTWLSNWTTTASSSDLPGSAGMEVSWRSTPTSPDSRPRPRASPVGCRQPSREGVFTAVEK